MSHHYPEPFYHFKSEHHLTNLSSAFKSLYDTADLVDITISVDGGTVKAHRVMLAASSPYFRNIIKVRKRAKFIQEIDLKKKYNMKDFFRVFLVHSIRLSFWKMSRTKILAIWWSSFTKGRSPWTPQASSHSWKLLRCYKLSASVRMIWTKRLRWKLISGRTTTRSRKGNAVFFLKGSFQKGSFDGVFQRKKIILNLNKF